LQARGEPRSPECLEGERHDCLVYSNRAISEEWRFRIGGEWHSGPPNRALSAKVRAFVDFLSDRFGGFRPFFERTFGQCVELEIADLRYTGSCPW